MYILFDLDGTLIDSTEAIVEGFFYAFNAHGLPLPKAEAITANIGWPLDEKFRRLGIPEELNDSFLAKYKELYIEIAKPKTFLIPNAKESVELAASFATLGVVTTKTSRFSIMLLEHLGILHHFDVVIGREDVVNPKPDPEPVLKAIDAIFEKKSFVADKDKTYLIGDTKMDVLSAKAAGIKSVGVMTGYGDKEEFKALCELLADDALDAVKIIAAKKQ